MAVSFDPTEHRRHRTRWFEDFSIGERFVLPSRTMTEGLFTAFQAASGDNHPIHYDAEFCKQRGLPSMLAHGFQVLIQTAAGTGDFPYMVEDSLIGFLEQRSRFLRPVFVGDTLYPALSVDELTPNTRTGVVGLAATVHNQKGLLVMTGSQRYLIGKKIKQDNQLHRLTASSSEREGEDA